MLDICDIRARPEVYLADLDKRAQPEKKDLFNSLLKKDVAWRALKKEADSLRQQRNKITSEIKLLKAAGKDASKQIASASDFPNKIKELESKTNALRSEIDSCLMRLPNVLHESVPEGKDDSENVVIKTWGKLPNHNFELQPHGEFLQNAGLADFDRATKVAGAGFYYLLGDFARLEMAIQMFGIDSLVKKGFILVEPPFMINRKAYEGVTDLDDFENVMYKIEGEDLYLIATSEHAIGSRFLDEIVEEKELPLKFAGISACFRKEIGSHGVDTKGIFRVHQFNKIEQFVFCKPEDSWKIHEELLENAEQFFQALKIPYQVVNVCTGDMGTVAAKKYDLEIWMPREKKYREAVSCSNCTSYQAVRSNIKVRDPKTHETSFVHTLNSTQVATGRALRAIVENFQTKEGNILIPKPLQAYMGGQKEIVGKKK